MASWISLGARLPPFGVLRQVRRVVLLIDLWVDQMRQDGTLALEVLDGDQSLVLSLTT
jgi:hypothetical protein